MSLENFKETPMFHGVSNIFKKGVKNKNE